METDRFVIKEVDSGVYLIFDTLAGVYVGSHIFDFASAYFICELMNESDC